MSALLLLERLAEETWERMSDAAEFAISISEETHTDLNLLELRRAELLDVTAIKVGKQTEAKLGLDWDWWIGSDVCGWLRYVVQAKKLYLGTCTYETLRHELKDGRKPTMQIDRLVDFASSAQAIPIYCFYNADISPEFTRDCEVKDVRQYGCTVVSIDSVKIAHDKHGHKHFADLHVGPGAYPWRCIIANHCDWVQRVDRTAQRGHPLIASGRKVAGGEEWGVRIFSEIPQAIRDVVSGKRKDLPPEYYPGLWLPKRVAVIDISDEGDDLPPRLGLEMTK